MTERTFASVAIGDELGSTLHARAAAGNLFFGRSSEEIDFSRQTFERPYAEEDRGQVLPGLFSAALFTKLVDEWAGGSAQLDEVRCAFRRPIYAGVELALTGHVVGKREEDGRHLVDIEVAALLDGEPASIGSVVVAFEA